MNVYTVICCMSGQDYSTDDAYVLGVFTDLQDALDCFEAEITSVEPEEEGTNFEGNKTMYDSDKVVYEFTDFDEDCHGIIKVVQTILHEKSIVGINESSEEIPDIEYDEDYERSWGPRDSTED